LQLVDDKGQPLANVPYMLSERGTDRILQGSSDPQGLIHVEGLTARPYTLTLEAQSLADALTAISPPAAIQGKEKTLSDFCREQNYILSENNRAGAFNSVLPETVHRMTAGQIKRSLHYQQLDTGYPLLFPYDQRRVIAIKSIAEPVFAKSILRGEGNTDAGVGIEELVNFGECNFTNYTCGIISTEKQSVSSSNWIYSLFSSLNPISNAHAIPLPMPVRRFMPNTPLPIQNTKVNSFDYSDEMSGKPSWVSEDDYRIAKGMAKAFNQPTASVTLNDMVGLGVNIFFGMVAHYFEGDSTGQQDLLEIAEIGGSAPTRLRVGFGVTGTNAIGIAAASQLIAYHTERDSGYDQVPVIKGELAYEYEAREILSLPINQSPDGLPSESTPTEVYRFDIGSGRVIFMAVTKSGKIANLSIRLDDLPDIPPLPPNELPEPKKIEVPEGITIPDIPLTSSGGYQIPDDDIRWVSEGVPIPEQWDLDDFILTVDKHDVDSVYISVNEKVIKKKRKSRSGRPDPLEEAEGRAHTIIEKPGRDGQYTTHYEDGTWKQYRGSGKPHGDIGRPNIKETKIGIDKDGNRYINSSVVRKPTEDEYPGGKQ
ncbi:TPA: hypothetical protein ACHV9H_004196, partial [Providencia stuartii]